MHADGGPPQQAAAEIDVSENERIAPMFKYMKSFLGLKSDNRAVTALEYGLIAAVVVAVGLAGFNTMGTTLKTKMDSVQTKLTAGG